MKVLFVETGKEPRVLEIEHTLEAMRTLVQGDIEAIYPFPDEIALVDNDEGKLIGLPPNRVVGGDIIAGNFFLAGVNEEDFCDISEDLAERYTDFFRYPDVFIPTPEGTLIVLRRKA